MARSRGGKGRLASPAGPVLQGEFPLGPPLPPATHGDGGKVCPPRRLDMGEERLAVQPAGQGGPLPFLKRRGALPQEGLGNQQEVRGEDGAVRRVGARHGRHPVGSGSNGFIATSAAYPPAHRNLISICETKHLAARRSSVFGRLFVALDRLGRDQAAGQQTSRKSRYYWGMSGLDVLRFWDQINPS